MRIRTKLTLHGDYILIAIDFTNAYNEMDKDVMVERHMDHPTLIKLMPYWRATLGPRSQRGKTCGTMKGSLKNRCRLGSLS